MAHATRAHGHRALLRFDIAGPQCPACAMLFHTRPRCLHHVRVSARCKAAVIFEAPRLLPEAAVELDAIDRKATAKLKRAGLAPFFAALPAYLASLPEGSVLLQPPPHWVPERRASPVHRFVPDAPVQADVHPHGVFILIVSS